MSVDNTKLLFSSEWDIDQILYQGTTNTLTVPKNTNPTPITVPIASFSLNFPPVAIVQYKLTGDTVWRQPNDVIESTFGPNLNLFLTTSTTGIAFSAYNYSATTDATFVVRYFVWTDKVNYL